MNNASIITKQQLLAAIGGGAIAIDHHVLITGPSGDDGLEGVSATYLQNKKSIRGVWTVCHDTPEKTSGSV